MKRILFVLLTVLCSASLQAQSEKKVTPVLEVGAGLSVKTNSGYGESVNGLATEFTLGLEIRLDDKWSVMPQIGHNLMLNDLKGLFGDYLGGDPDYFSFYNAAVLGRYKLEDGVAIGFGPAFYIIEDKDTYYIDADPSDPRNGRAKLKPWDFGLRATLTKDCGKHWRIGALANVGLRNMLCQYPDAGVTGSTHLYSLCFTVGFRF